MASSGIYFQILYAITNIFDVIYIDRVWFNIFTIHIAQHSK